MVLAKACAIDRKRGKNLLAADNRAFLHAWLMAYMDENETPHIIVCGNFSDLNAYIRSAFVLNGYEAHQALSASECIDKFKKLNDVIDAIIVNGKIAADRSVMLVLKVRRMNMRVKVFVLADKTLSEEKTRIMDYGADAFAVKPISVETMIDKVNSMLLESAMVVSSKQE